jgi:hypothetical protein
MSLGAICRLAALYPFLTLVPPSFQRKFFAPGPPLKMPSRTWDKIVARITDCYAATPLSRRRSSGSVIANTAQPQSKQTTSFGNTQTPALSSPCGLGKWMFVSASKRACFSDLHDKHAIHQNSGPQKGSSISVCNPERNFVPAAKNTISGSLVIKLP